MAGERRPWRPALALLCAACWRQGAGLKAFLKQPSDSGSFEDLLLGPAPSTPTVAPYPEASGEPDAEEQRWGKQFRVADLQPSGAEEAASSSDADSGRSGAQIRNLAKAFGSGSAEEAASASAGSSAAASEQKAAGRAGDAGAAGKATSASSSSTASERRGVHIKANFKDLFGLGGTEEAADASASSRAATSEQWGAQIAGKLKDRFGLGGAGEAAGGAASSGQAGGQIMGKVKDLFGMGAGEVSSASSSSTASEKRGMHIKANFKDLFGLGGTEEAASGGQSEGTQEQEEARGQALREAAEGAEMFQHLSLMKEALGIAKAERVGSSHKEGGFHSFKAHLGEMKKATKNLMGSFVNVSSPSHALQDIAQRTRSDRERRRRLNIQRQLLRGTPLSHSDGEPTLRRMDDEADREERPVSLLALRRGDARAGEPDPARERIRASRERLLAKLAASREAGRGAVTSNSTPAPVSAPRAAGKAQGEAEEEKEEEEDKDGLDETVHHHTFGHGEILAEVLDHFEHGVKKVGKSMSKDVKAALRNINEEADYEHGDPNFLLDPVGKVQAVTDKIHRLTNLFTGGLRSVAHNAGKAVGKKGLEDILLDGLRIHKTPHTGE